MQSCHCESILLTKVTQTQNLKFKINKRLLDIQCRELVIFVNPGTKY